MPISVKVTIPGDAEELLRRLTRTRIALEDLRPAWDLLAVRIAQHVDERWSNPRGIAPLAESTQEAKRRRWGYYRSRADSSRATGSGSTAFWHRGKSLGQATKVRRSGRKPYKATKANMIYDFGARNENWRRLDWMHRGSDVRPAREIYLPEVVAKLARSTVEEYLEEVVRSGGVFTVRNANA